MPEFAKAVEYGRTLGDADVVDGFRQIAMGCFPEVVTIAVGAEKEPLTYIRHRPPNGAARNFWLRNRLPGECRQKAEIVPDRSRGSVRRRTRSGLQRLIAGLAAAEGLAEDG